jgi:hypothetical protein
MTHDSDSKEATDGAGRVVLELTDDPVTEFAGALTGVYGPHYLEELRDEWA